MTVGRTNQTHGPHSGRDPPGTSAPLQALYGIYGNPKTREAEFNGVTEPRIMIPTRVRPP
jgi:hypothetical protein